MSKRASRLRVFEFPPSPKAGKPRRRRISPGGGPLLDPLEVRLLLSVATINWATQEQTIAGFGASSAWMSGTFTSSQQQLLWSVTNGAGLSLLRSHINADTSSSSSEISIMQEATAMGVTVFSTPWSPPAQWKSNDNTADIVNGVDTGGYLLPADYQNYANWLAQYVVNMKNDGITVYAVSMQNEPDWQASYESAIWTPAEFDTVLFQYLEPTFAQYGISSTKIILPEETHWDSLNLAATVLADPQLANYSNIIFADHTYGDDSNNSPITGLSGDQIWETEHTGDDPNTGVQAALDLAEDIYHVVGQNQASAYNYWWINSGGGAGLLAGNWQINYNYSAMENFSKFIRPGWVQVGESDDNSGLQIAAFKSPTTGQFATELINNTSSPITETINFNGAYSPVVTPWITSATLSLAEQQSIPATGNGGSYTYTVPAKSIVTLTGTAGTTPVTESPVGLMASSATTGSITLGWTSNLASATGYTLQRSSDGLNWTTLTSAIPAGTYTYTDTGLSANTLYYYRVQANNGTVFSNAVAQMTQPPAPTNLTATYNASNQSVSLSWTRNGSSATDYAVDVSSDGGNTWTTITAGLSSTTASYTDTSPAELATLQYRVRAVYGTNSSAPTNIMTVTTTVLKAPSGLTVAAGGSSAVLTWTDNTTTSSTVSIEKSTDGTNWTVIASVAHGVQTYTDTSVVEGGTYYYRIRNYDSAATPPTYSAYATTTAVTVPPAAPTNVEVEFSPQPTLTAKVIWVDNATSETAYEVDRSSNSGSTWTTLTTTLPPGSTTYTDTTVVSGQSYEYRVEALHNTLSSAQVTTLSETASVLPAPFAHGDIGTAGTLGLAGSATYNATNSSYTLTGAGSDIWNNADGFQYAYTTLTGDGSIVTQVTSMANFVNYGKAGLMMRNSLDPTSAYAIAFLTPQGTANFEERASAGAASASKGSVGTFSTPLWLKLTRAGSSFSVYYSTNGSTWTQVGSSFSISMGSTIYVGLITSAHSNAQLATATFASTSLTGTGNQAPTISSPAAANLSVSGTTATLSATGADDGGAGNLTYTWTTTGTPPAPVTFSTNGQNASKTALATFTSAGNYSFLVTITDQFGLSVTSSATLTVNQLLIGPSVTPTTLTVAPGASVPLTFAVIDQFGNPIGSQSSATWSIASGAGSVNASGIYTAPASETGLVTVRAVGSSGQTAYATLDVLSQFASYPANSTGGTLLSDVSGHGYNGTLNGAATFGPGVNGNALALSGGYAQLPAGLVSSLTNFTITAWVDLSSVSSWARIFDFGSGTNTYMYLTPQNGNTKTVGFGITTSSSGGEQVITGAAPLATGSWQFVAVTLNGSVGTLYVNGVAVGTNSSMSLHPSSLGSTTQDYLGKSQWSSDPALAGSIDDFQIVGRALSAAEIQQLARPSIVSAATASNLTSTSATLSVLGSDITSGEAGLKYTWATSGTPPAPVTFSANGTNAAKTTQATFTKPGTYQFLVTITNSANVSVSAPVSVTVNSSIAGRYLFYGGSVYDGATHDTAIAPDKVALLPGQTASFANYSNYSRGINGISIDIANPGAALSAADFVFTVGNDDNPSAWSAAPAPISVVNRPGAGVNGSTRVEITWADNAIADEWLQITVLANSDTMLAAADTFYFGSAPGDVGDSATDAYVDAVDQIAIRANNGPAGITDPYDINRDGVVNSTDESIARANDTDVFDGLQLITVPGAPAAPAFMIVPAVAAAASTGVGVTAPPAENALAGPVESDPKTDLILIAPGAPVAPVAASPFNGALFRPLPAILLPARPPQPPPAAASGAVVQSVEVHQAHRHAHSLTTDLHSSFLIGLDQQPL